LQAIEDSPNDIECYKHIHAYIHYLLNTPKLKSILDAEEKDYYTEIHRTIDGYKVEQGNFYFAYFLTSYMRIYAPIEIYNTSYEPDSEQDPIALILLYGYKHPRTQSWVNRFQVPIVKRERKQQLKSYWSWFDGKREEYVNEIKNLHLEIITVLSKQPDKPNAELKSKNDLSSLLLDLETGDFHYGKKTDSLNIKTQPFRVLSKLYSADGKTVPYLDLIQCIKPNAKEVTKTDKMKLTTVIKNLKKSLGITDGSNPDIFHNEKMVGYSLRYID
jgi:hypothetical protein